MNPGQRLRLMVARGIANLINDAGGLQVLQASGLDGEVLDGVERVQNFGQSGVPMAGATLVLVAVGGSRNHMVCVGAENDAHRPKGLQPGESATYNAHGVLFLFDQDGNARLSCKKFIVDASEGIEANTPLATFSQAVTANGLFTYKAGMAGSNGAGGTTTISGDIEHSGGQFISNGVVVHLHQHGDVQPGMGLSGLPT